MSDLTDKIAWLRRHESPYVNNIADEIERLRAALDAACETIETQPQVGRSIDYANGFRRGMQCQRLHAKFIRDKALEGGDE